MHLPANFHHVHPRLLSIARHRPATVFLSLYGPSRRWNHSPPPSLPPKKPLQALRDNIYTFPNLLTVSRIASCPVLATAIMGGNHKLATGILLYAGVSDWVDGFLARRYNMKSVFGTILDPAADKALVTTLAVTLGLKGLIPLPLVTIIIGRDVLLSFWAFYIRYKTLPPPKTFKRYWDFSLPSAEVRPTFISKVNTALQLLLMGATTVSPLLPAVAAHIGGLTLDIPMFLTGLQYSVGATTIWSGLSYAFARDGFVVSARKKTNS